MADSSVALSEVISDMSDSARSADGTHRKYPKDASIRLAASGDAEAFYFKTPVGSVMQVPAMNAEQARQLAADEYRGFGPEDFERVDGFGSEHYEDYPTPVESGREVNEHDLWMLRAAMRKGSRVGLEGKHSPRKNPTEYTIERLLDEWDDPTDVPLHDLEALQQADGIGPDRAAQAVGAAVANGLIHRPVRGDE